MIRHSLAGLFLLLSAGLFAQNGTSSPYSFYGIGEIVARGTADARAMGGIGVVSDSIHINLLNPASYASIKRTSLGVGAVHTRATLTTNADEGKAHSTNLNYLSVAIPLKKWGFGFGVMPYSSVGYRFRSVTPVAGSTTDFDEKRYYGSGGVNRAYFGGAYSINDKLNVGAQVDVNFGQIETVRLLKVHSGGFEYGARENTNSDLKGSTFTLGLNYKSRVAKKYDFYASGTYSFGTRLKSKYLQTLSSIAFSGDNETIIDKDTIAYDKSRYVDMPSRLTFGAGIGRAHKWLVAAEASFASAGSGLYDITTSNIEYDAASRYSVGGYFIPRYDAYKGYFKRVVYRGGFRYEDTGLSIDGHKIEDMAFTFGFGFPMRGSFTNLNLGVELGQRGTKAGGLIHENYTKFTLAFSFSDLWFVKPKYD